MLFIVASVSYFLVEGLYLYILYSVAFVTAPQLREIELAVFVVQEKSAGVFGTNAFGVYVTTDE